jgi:hypothetical protein
MPFHRAIIEGMTSTASDDPPGTCVVLTAPENRLSAMDVATGPCVPLQGRKRSLVSVHQQEGPERLDQMAALFTALKGHPSEEALQLVEQRGEGGLYRCSDDFVDAMADANQLLVRLSDEDRTRKDADLTTFAAQRRQFDEAWMQAAQWHASMVSTQNRLSRLGKARIAREKEEQLFCWYGPKVPEYVVVAGRGPYPAAH